MHSASGVPVAIAERPRSTGMYARRTTPGRRPRFGVACPCLARTDVCATGWLVSTTDPRFCRNECFIRAHIYTWTGILTHASSALPTIVVQPFDRSGRKSDRRLGALPADNLQAVTGAPDGPVLLSLPPIIARGVPQPDR